MVFHCVEKVDKDITTKAPAALRAQFARDSVGYRGSSIFLALKLIFVKLKVYLSKGFR